jgi:hypothetical protein
MIQSGIRTSAVSSFAILVILFSIAVAPPAKADIVPWLTGFFPSSDGFSMGTSFGDSFVNIIVSPDLPVITVSWQCDDLGICVGQGSAPITGGSADGGMWSDSTGTLLATFTGHVTGGGASRYEQFCPDDICLTYFDYAFHADFSGTWSNGWHTVGFAEGTFGSDTSDSGLFYLTTYTPEPATLTLVAAGLAGVYCRMRRR